MANPLWLPRMANPLWLPRIIGAGTGACPYENDDAVHMVGHDDKRVYIDARVTLRQFAPYCLDHLAGAVQDHFPTGYLAEHSLPVLRADGHEIRSGLSIIIRGKPD